MPSFVRRQLRRLALYRTVLSVRRRIQFGIGRFCRAFLASVVFVRTDLKDGLDATRSGSERKGGAGQRKGRGRERVRRSEGRGAAAPWCGQPPIARPRLTQPRARGARRRPSRTRRARDALAQRGGNGAALRRAQRAHNALRCSHYCE